MSRSVKCKICGNQLTNDIAYKVVVNGKNQYYCSDEEYNAKQKEKESKDKCLKTITEILGSKIVSPVMVKKVNELRKFYDYMVIDKTFKECANTISWALGSKDFNSEFAKTKYIISIVANNIDKVYKKHIKDLKDMERLFSKNEVEPEIIDLDINRPINDRNISDISSFLD